MEWKVTLQKLSSVLNILSIIFNLETKPIGQKISSFLLQMYYFNIFVLLGSGFNFMWKHYIFKFI